MARKNYPGNLTKEGRGFRWRVCVGGERHSETLYASTHTEAVKRARERHRELRGRHERRSEGLATDVSVSELFALYERDKLPRKAPGTQRTYKESLKPFREYFVDRCKDPAVEKIRKAHIEGYLAWRAVNRVGGGVVGNRMLSKERAVLHAIFAFAGKLELCAGNPVKESDNPKWDKREPIILDDSQYEKLLGACEHHPMLWFHVLTLGEAGLRCNSESLWLRWEDVDLKGGWLSIVSGRDGHRTKGGKSRLVPMTARLREAMAEHKASYRLASPWVFHHLITKRLYAAGTRIQSLRGSFDNAKEEAKLPAELVRHDLRHRRVTTWLAAGKDLVKVQRAMGHSNVKITMEYLHLVPNDLRDLVDDPKEGLEELAV
jgi:integrase